MRPGYGLPFLFVSLIVAGCGINSFEARSPNREADKVSTREAQYSEEQTVSGIESGISELLQDGPPSESNCLDSGRNETTCGDTPPETPVAPPNVPTQALCEELLGLSAYSGCRLPISQIFGGSFQTGGVTLLNPRTNRTSCPSGFSAIKLADVHAFRRGEDALGAIDIFICLAERNQMADLPSSVCPAGQSQISVGGQRVCSDIPRRACHALNGVFNGQTGKCSVFARETVFGGVFETGEVNRFGTVTIRNPDDRDQNGLPRASEENCETPNTFSGLSRCACPANFTAFSSSSFNEFSAGSFDRLSYCIRNEVVETFAQANLAPRDGCSKTGEQKFTIGADSVCLQTLAEMCQQMNGVYNTTTEKCSLGGSSFFGGSFQLGWSSHQGFAEVPQNLRDPALSGRRQFCEAPNPKLPLTVQRSSSGCQCPSGFTRHPLGHVEEGNEDYDKEFICIRN